MKESVLLGELMATGNRSVDPRKRPEELFELYSIPAFDAGSSVLIQGRDIGSPKQIVQPGDVLLSRIVPHIRRAWVVPPSAGPRAVGSSEWIVFRGERFHPSYLRHVLLSDRFHLAFMTTVAGVGGSLLRARPANVARIEIPLPVILEQRRIALILDQADSLRVKRRASIALIEKLKGAAFGEIVGTSMNWRETTLADFLALPLRNGISPSTRGLVSASVLTLSAVTGNGFDSKARKTASFLTPPPSGQRVSREDFLICRGNGNLALVGKGHFPGQDMADVAFPDTVIAARIAPDRVDRAFLEYIWGTTEVRRQIESLARTTNGTYKVNQTMLESIRLPAPPIEIQRQFGQAVGRIGALQQRASEAANALDLVFASLQHRAFAGER